MDLLKIEVRAPSQAALAEHARIPIAFEVREVLLVPGAVGAHLSNPLATRNLDAPYVKDYDALAGEGPLRWGERFNLSYWQLFAAIEGGRHVGAAAVVLGSPEVGMCEGRSDLAVVWDIRVSPEQRSRGVGSALFRAVEAWAATRGGRGLQIETQHTNVPACRFYVRQGCTLRAIHRLAYPELPDEIQLLWYKELSVDDAG